MLGGVGGRADAPDRLLQGHHPGSRARRPPRSRSGGCRRPGRPAGSGCGHPQEFWPFWPAFVCFPMWPPFVCSRTRTSFLAYRCVLGMLTEPQLAVLRASPPTSRVATAISLAGVTQVTVAKAIGVTQAYVSDVARQRYSTITVARARKFTRFFGCSIDDLFPPGDNAGEWPFSFGVVLLVSDSFLAIRPWSSESGCDQARLANPRSVLVPVIAAHEGAFRAVVISPLLAMPLLSYRHRLRRKRANDCDLSAGGPGWLGATRSRRRSGVRRALGASPPASGGLLRR